MTSGQGAGHGNLHDARHARRRACTPATMSVVSGIENAAALPLESRLQTPPPTDRIHAYHRARPLPDAEISHPALGRALSHWRRDAGAPAFAGASSIFVGDALLSGGSFPAKTCARLRSECLRQKKTTSLRFFEWLDGYRRSFWFTTGGGITPGVRPNGRRANHPIRSEACEPGEAGKTTVLFPLRKTRRWICAWIARARTWLSTSRPSET